MILFERTTLQKWSVCTRNSLRGWQQISPRSQNRTQLLVFMRFGDKRRFGLDCQISNPDFEREIRKWILPPRHPSSRWISNMKSKSGFHDFWLRNPKRDLQNCSRAVNSGLFSTHCAYPCIFAFLENSFLYPFWMYKTKTERKKIRTDFLAMKSVFEFCVRLKIPTWSWFWNLNPGFPIERTLFNRFKCFSL